MKAADRAFFRAIEERGESRERAAIRLSGAAMEFFFKKDFDTAMKRFNQAWMLDPRNSIPYFGFAKILELRDRNPAGASLMYRKSIEQADAPAFVFTEYLDLLVRRGLFEIGVATGKAAILRHPGNADIHGYYAFSAYKTGDRAVACRQAARALEIGDAKNVALARSLAALSNSDACAR